MNISVPACAAPLPSKADLLLQLAARCEREEPNDELNWSIMEAVRPDHRQTQATPYAHSLDAAVTLVPEDGFWMVRNGSSLTIPGAAVSGQFGAARTPTLALCAAALRARAAMET